MTIAVVDASVAVKWVIDEHHSDAALSVLRAAPLLHAPAHWLAEAGNTLWAKAAIHQVISASEMQERLALLSSLPVAVTQLPELMAAAGDLAIDLHLTIYDTLYLALAERRNIPFVTADRRLHDRALTNALRFASPLDRGCPDMAGVNGKDKSVTIFRLMGDATT